MERIDAEISMRNVKHIDSIISIKIDMVLDMENKRGLLPPNDKGRLKNIDNFIRGVYDDIDRLQDFKAVFVGALDRLEDTERQVLYKTIVEDKSIYKISVELGYSERTIMRYEKRARLNILPILEEIPIGAIPLMGVERRQVEQCQTH